MDVRTVLGAGLNQLAGVVAIAAAHNDDHVALAGQIARRTLPLFRRLADGIGESDFGPAKNLPKMFDQLFDSVDRLSGLCRQSKLRSWSYLRNIRFAENHVIFFEILRHSSNFHMVSLADDHGVVAFSYELADRAVCMMNQGAGSLKNLEALGTRLGNSFLRGAVCCDHRAPSAHPGGLGFSGDSSCAQIFQHSLIMNKLSQDGERFVRSLAVGQSDSVADAETHSEMMSANDSHKALRYKVKW